MRENNPHSILLMITPMIGETQHSGEILPRILTLEEISVLGIPPQVVLTQDYPNYRQALLGLKESLECVKLK